MEEVYEEILSNVSLIGKRVDSMSNDFEEIISEIDVLSRRSDKYVKISCVGIFFKYFDRYPQIRNRVFEMLKDPDIDIRMFIIHRLAGVCVNKSYIKPVCHALTQLLINSKESLEVVVVKSNILKLVKLDENQCLRLILEYARNADHSIRDKLNIMYYIEDYLRPRCNFQSDIIAEINEFYVQIIQSVSKDDAHFLLQCLSVNISTLTFYQIISALKQRLNDGVFSVRDLMKFITKKVDPEMFPRSSSGVRFIILDFMESLMSVADIEELEMILMKSATINVLSIEELENTKTSVLENCIKEGIAGDNSRSVLEKLYRMTILTKIGNVKEECTIIVDWMYDNIAFVDRLDRISKRNYFMMMATLSQHIKVPKFKKEVITAVFDYFWTFAPDRNTIIRCIDVFDLEIICFIINNLFSSNQATFDVIESTEPNWRRRLEYLKEMLATTTSVLKKKKLRTLNKERRREVVKSLFALNSCGVSIFFFLTSRVNHDIALTPTWMCSNEKVFDNVTYCHVWNNRNSIDLSSNAAENIAVKRDLLFSGDSDSDD